MHNNDTCKSYLVSNTFYSIKNFELIKIYLVKNSFRPAIFMIFMIWMFNKKLLNQSIFHFLLK